MFVYLKTPDVGTQGQNEGGRLVGGEVRAREGAFFLFFFLFFFFNIIIFVVKVQETVWSASYDPNKTIKQSNGPLHLVMGQTNTPRP